LKAQLTILAALSLAGLSSSRGEPRERRFKIDYSVSVDKMPTLTDRVDVWIPVPHNDAYQSISRLSIEAPYPYKIEKGEFGNQMLHLRIIKPLENSFLLDVQFVAKRKEHLRMTGSGASAAAGGADERDPNLDRWLQPDRLVPLDDKIRGWAQEVVKAAGAQSELDKARAIYNHIVDTVKYDKTGKGWGRGDIYYACDARRGNCTDFHAIFIGYARALGIPARFSIGLPIPAEHGQGTIAGYHCWAEFYVKGMGWIPVDASEAAKDPAKRQYFFGAHDENRVEFSRGRDLTLTPKQQGDPLNYFVYPYVEVDGKPYANVSHTFRYSDLSR
jgi:transglutaminase-like putative cysteine protease